MRHSGFFFILSARSLHAGTEKMQLYFRHHLGLIIRLAISDSYFLHCDRCLLWRAAA